jgi:hypothetical protein
MTPTGAVETPAPVTDDVEAPDVLGEALTHLDALTGAEGPESETELADAAPEGAAPEGDDADPAPADAAAAEAAPTGAPGSAPAATDAAQATEALPFAFKAENRWNAVPGTTWDPQRGTITVQSREALDHLQKYLGMGFKYEQVTKPELFALRRQVAEMQQQVQPEVEQAKLYLQEWQRLMEMEPEQLAEFIMGARQQWPMIQARAERAVAERMLEQARRAQQPPEPDVETIVEEARSGAAQLVQEILQGQPWASAEVAHELTEYLQDMQQMDQWVLKAQRDFPEMGVRAGQYVANWDVARQMLDRLTAGYRRSYQQVAHQQHQQAARVQQATRVAAANAAAVAQARATPAPRPAARATPGRPGPSATGTPRRSAAETKSDIIAEAFAQWRTMKTG